jgi:hypothetical protein
MAGTWSRISTLTAAGLAGAALAAGGAHAVDRPDDRAGLLGVGAAAAGRAVLPAPDAFERAALRSSSARIAVPDAFERAAARGAAAPPADAFERAVERASAGAAVRPDDRPGTRGPGLAPVVLERAAAGEAFGWGDALVGAGAALGAVLVAGAAALTIRHRGRVILP